MRRILVTLTALALVLALAAPAFAGGWAATTLDDLPAAIHAGQTYDIGYTIRQHGVTPVNVEEFGGTTEIRATAPDKKSVSFAGVRQGPTGHYVAKVTFPSEGPWVWLVTQGPFEAQALGTITVAPAIGAAQGAPAGAPAQQPGSPSGFLAIALLLATAGAAILFGTRIAAFTGRRAAT